VSGAGGAGKRNAGVGVMAKDLYLPRNRYRAALQRQRDRIADGLRFEAVDNDVTGNKYTHASWGLCSRDHGAWPDAEDHLWPDQFAAHGRVAPKYRNQHQPCPMQNKGGAQGCFYSCRIFHSGEIGPSKRDDALALYDAAILKATGASNG